VGSDAEDSPLHSLRLATDSLSQKENS